MPQKAQLKKGLGFANQRGASFAEVSHFQDGRSNGLRSMVREIRARAGGSGLARTRKETTKGNG